MTPLVPPPSLNYIAAFLTMDCNLNCSYCINDPIQRGDRRTIFMSQGKRKTELTPTEWIVALKRLPLRSDLPVTFQGGEPSMYWKGEGLGEILEGTEVYADLLTNFALPTKLFAAKLRGQHRKFQRRAAYPSIRVSYHEVEMKKLWGEKAFEELVERCVRLKDFGFQVSPDPAKSDVGIYVVDHPENHITDEMKLYCCDKIPLFIKDFLGVDDEELYGQYAYPFSTDILSRKIYHRTLSCDCRTTELLIDPLGYVWRCHYFLYKAWEEKREGKNDPNCLGNMLDPNFTLSELETFRPCDSYGKCIGCDTKFKKDRFSTEGSYRTSVIIRNIAWPEELRAKSVILRSPSVMHTSKI